MLAKLRAFFDLLRKGEAVADPEKWKKRQITTSMLAALLAAVMTAIRAFGIDVETNQVQLEAVAMGLLSIYAFGETIFTAISSKKVGFLPPKDP